MSNNTRKPLEEDGRSFEGNSDREVEEEGFFNFKEEGSCSSLHQTWSPFEDLDDSGHFTASPEGERALSGSSRSHSPCPSSAHLLLQMQPQDSNGGNSQDHHPQLQLHSTQMQFTPKPLISPRSVMTVKVPHSNLLDSFRLNTNNLMTTVQSSEEHDNCSTESNDMSHESQSYENGGGGGGEDAPHSRGDGISQANFVTTVRNGGTHFNSNTKETEDSSDYLRSILDNFNSLYMEKLKMIDDIPTASEEQKMFLLEKKTNILENWAKDVCVQNMVLVHTVEELEKEANRKVAALQAKITESTQLAKQHMNMIKKCEEQVKVLLKNHGDAEEKNLVLKIELEKLKSECRRVKDRMNSLLKDNDSLITLVCRIRDMGVWDVNGLELQRSSFDQIFGLYPNLVGGEVQTVFTREKAKRVKDTEDKVALLESQLKDAYKSQNEIEANSLIKDGKIEELETEIKNLSNKIKYSEQECNDYKKQLLETQEKLLEATRKLNSSKYSARSPRKSEMTELIKELRDVKSQLNLAVEEKQSAKEESNYFKRELGDRLKEMHDIQNVFQKLASEVVNSRAAFQQVQEKEVQLSSLKSEVQTYQSRCADAEDTIRKKEREIKQLQKQMNEIHKRSKKVPSFTSIPTVTASERPESGTGKFNPNYLRSISNQAKLPSRNMKAVKVIKPQKNGGKIKTILEPPPTQSTKDKSGSSESYKENPPTEMDAKDHERPPWNTHFKNLGLASRPPPAVRQSSRSSLSKASVGESSTKKHPPVKPEDLFKNAINPEAFFEKLTDIEERFASKKDTPKAKTAKESSKVLKPKEDSHMKELKLPRVESSSSIHKKLSRARSDSVTESGLKGERLPKVKSSSKPKSKPIDKESHKKVNTNPILKNLLQNPIATTPRLNELITAVVETSKQLLGGGEESPVMKNKDISSFTITAARYHKNKNKDQRRAKSNDKLNRKPDSDVGGGDGGDVRVPKTPTKFHSSTGVHFEKEEKENPKSPDPPEDVQDILRSLPQESNDDIVKSWIKRSSEHSLEGKQKKPQIQLPPKVSRRPSVKVMKHLATRRFPKRLDSAGSKLSSESFNKEDMFEMDDDWEKVFTNLESNTKGASAKAAAAPTKPAPVKYKVDNTRSSFDESPTEQDFSSVQTQTSDCSDSESANNDHTHQSNTTLCQDSMQKLLDRLAAENREIKERFAKELQEKDIELRMQKVTIQHLQDAYVALKRGQPIPVPHNVTGNKIIVNGSSNGHNTSNNSQVLDV